MDGSGGVSGAGGGRPPGRASQPADDASPLNGPRIDVGARIGWLARTARQLRGGPALRRLEDMASATGAGQSRVHRIETGQQRHAAVLATYERLLGLDAGALCAPVDLLCRAHPGAGPRELGPRGAVDQVSELSAMTEVLLDHEVRVGGGTWLSWSRAMAESGGIGLPVPLARSIVARLVDELSRAVGPAVAPRQEALAQLRCGAYGGLVLDEARARVEDPAGRVAAEVVCAVATLHAPEVLVWLLGLLDDDRESVVVAGAQGIESIGARVGGDVWALLLPHLLASLDVADEGSVRWAWTSHLLRSVPAGAWRVHGAGPVRRLAPRPAIRDWSRGRANPHWTRCRAGGAAVASRLGLDSEAMVARLMFDVAIGPRETRAALTTHLLLGLPEVATEVGVEIADAVGDMAEDPVLQQRTARRLVPLLAGGLPDPVRSWATTDRPGLRDCALRAAGAAGVQLPVETLEVSRRVPDLLDATLVSAGLSAHPVLDSWLSDPRPEVADGARGWVRRGPRLVR